MSSNENRRYKRVEHVTSRQIIRLDDKQTPRKNIVLTRDLSGSGIQFTTSEDLLEGTFFLLYLNDVLLDDIDQNASNLIKTGNYYLAQVVWSQKVAGDRYDVGAVFRERKACEARDIETFTELVNVSMLDQLPDVLGHL